MYNQLLIITAVIKGDFIVRKCLSGQAWFFSQANKVTYMDIQSQWCELKPSKQIWLSSPGTPGYSPSEDTI